MTSDMMGIATRRETGVNCRDGRSPRGARILGNNGGGMLVSCRTDLTFKLSDRRAVSVCGRFAAASSSKAVFKADATSILRVAVRVLEVEPLQ
jgi:hypothetical protein